MVKSQCTIEVQREGGEQRGWINLAAEVRGACHARERECTDVCATGKASEREAAIVGHRVGESMCE